jgi:hypothetical protein
MSDYSVEQIIDDNEIILKNKPKKIVVPLSYNNDINITNIKNIVLIHDQVYDYNKFVQSVNLESYPIVYNLNSSKDDLLNLLKDKFSHIERISFVFHNSGIDKLKQFINNESLFTFEDLEDNVNKYSNNLLFIIDLVKEFNIKNLDYLACNTLQYDHWNKYYDIIHKETNVIIGASNDLTGNIKYGGDWVLESTNEDIRNIYFTEEIIQYQYTLDTTIIEQDGGTLYIKQDIVELPIEYSSDNSSWIPIDNASWPLQIVNTYLSSNILTVQFNTNLTFSTNGYFLIGSEYITINGNNKVVTIKGITNYLGLIQNGTVSNNGFTNIIIEDLGIVASNGTALIRESGWIGQGSFGRGINSGTISISNCYSTGSITNSGGIFGSYTGINASGGTITASNCYSTGYITEGSGGIFGDSTGSLASGVTITASYCYSTGNVEFGCGGIFGHATGSLASGTFSITASNCYSAGAIFGNYTGERASGGTITASNCYSVASIAVYGGGIFGDYTSERASGGTITASYCYSIGNIGNLGGGIFGSYTGINASGGTITASNCYTTGNIGDGAGGIFGYSTGNVSGTTSITASKCYTIGAIGNLGGGIFGLLNRLGTSTDCIYVGVFTQENNIWSDNNATLTIKKDDSTPSKWLDYSSESNVPWLLSSFNASIYTPNLQNLEYGTSGVSSNGLFTPDYTYSIISTSPNTPSITINSTTGILTFPDTLSIGTYTINVLVGKINSSSSVYYYNTNIYTLNVYDIWYSISIQEETDTIFTGYFKVGNNNVIQLFYNADNITTDILIAQSSTITGVQGSNDNTVTNNIYQRNNPYFPVGGTTINDIPYYNSLYPDASIWVLWVDTDNSSRLTYYSGTTWTNLNTITNFTIEPITDPSCFNEGTKILCLNKNLEEEYIPIENLRKGDIVKSYKHGYRKIDLIGKNPMINNPYKNNECMYKMKKTDDNGLIEDLIITYGHSILVDDLGEYKEENDKIFGSTIMIDDKYLLLAGLSKDFVKLENKNLYIYYHFILENNGNEDERFGVWANGILTETPSKKYFNNYKYTLL